MEHGTIASIPFVPTSRAPPFEPAATKSRAAETPDQMRIPLHAMPDYSRAMVFDHGHDRSLVRTQVIAGDPARSGNDFTVLQIEIAFLHEGRIEGVKETVAPENVIAIAIEHTPNAGELGRSARGVSIRATLAPVV
jgi:hypothetical protein